MLKAAGDRTEGAQEREATSKTGKRPTNPEKIEFGAAGLHVTGARPIRTSA